jgi:hypothetical protein
MSGRSFLAKRCRAVYLRGMPSDRDLAIPNACDVDYESMTERSSYSRTCERCQTTVHDLTAMDSAEADDILARAAREKICVKAGVDGRGRINIKRSLAVLGPVLAVACGGERMGQVVMGKVEPTETESAAPSSGPPSATPSATSSAPRAWDIQKDATQLHIVDKPGTIVDSTAPPPLPGQPLAQHPFLSGSCFGDPLGCSKAGDILRQSTSTDDYIARLTKAGYTVKPSSTP